MPWLLLASSTMTSSTQPRVAVGIGKVASVATPTIEPSSRRARNWVMASWASIACTASSDGGGFDRDSCGTRCSSAACSSSASAGVAIETVTANRQLGSGTGWGGGGPTYLADGRMIRLSAACSRMLAHQPITRLDANVGVNSSGGSPQWSITTPA